MQRFLCFLSLFVLLGANATEEEQSFVLNGLPYAFDSLEPAIDSETMQIHWGRHHRAYTDNMNAALRTIKLGNVVSPRLRSTVTRALENKATSDIAEAIEIAKEEYTPEHSARSVLQSLRNNGGGYLNHNEYWTSILPNSLGGGVTDGSSPLELKIKESFGGSFDTFQSAFVEKGMSVFGSGWVWLIFDPSTRDLSIVTTANQDRPPPGSVVLLACDVWEHAYYLKRQSRRLEYLSAYFSVVNLKSANEKYVAALASCNTTK